MPRIEACAKTSVPPRLAGCNALPSILVGRPRWLSTSSGIRVSAQREGGRVELWASGYDVFRLADVRNDLLDRHLGAARHARHGERRAHQLQKAAAREPIEPLRCAFGEFAVHHLAEFGASRPALRGCASIPAPWSRRVAARRSPGQAFLLGQTSSRFDLFGLFHLLSSSVVSR